ncbi:NAD-dependent epimerase/dehydratase family protein [Spirosoma aerophilum]
MTILLTGASGYLGSRIYQILAQNHRVITLGRTVYSSRHLYSDLAEQVPVMPNERFDLVIHAAGKADPVPRTDKERADYQRVNVQGTAHLLKALDTMAVRPAAFVHLSTVLVYGCSAGHLLTETTSRSAIDPYGVSKIEAEKLLQEWAAQTGVRLTILRLPLVVAQPLKGNLAAMQQAIRKRYYVRFSKGLARRSMVRADDVAAVILRAASVGGIFNLTDGYHPTVGELEAALACQVGRENRIPVVPAPLASLVACMGDGINAIAGRRFPLDSIALQKLTSTLTFSDERARQQLNWSPRPVLDLFL